MCVWIHRNSLHLFLTASLTSKYQFNIKGSVGVHASVPSTISTRAHACVSPLLTGKCELYFKRSVNRKYTLGPCGEAGLMCLILGLTLFLLLSTSEWFQRRVFVSEVFEGEGDVVLLWRDSESGEQAASYLNSFQRGRMNQHPKILKNERDKGDEVLFSLKSSKMYHSCRTKRKVLFITLKMLFSSI